MTIDHHTALEEAVFRIANGNAGGFFDASALVLSAEWFGIAVGTAIMLWIALDGRRDARGRLCLALAFGLAIGLSDVVGAQVLRPLFGRMRPCFALPAGTVRWLAPAADVGSLPSLHAANFFAMAVVARAARRWLGAAAALVAVAVAASRVYVGVHWPTDVLAGAAWGALCAAAALALARRACASGPGPLRGRLSRPRDAP